MRPMRSQPAKRAQMEILGLAMIVILVIIGFFFALQIIITDDGLDPVDVITDRQLASTTIATMLNTNIACKPVTLTEVLQDCAVNNNLGYCSSNPANPGAPLRTACQEAFNVTGTILEATVGSWGRGYNFKAYNDPTQAPLLLHAGGDCDPSTFQESESETFPLPTSRGTLYLEMVICV